MTLHACPVSIQTSTMNSLYQQPVHIALWNWSKVQTAQTQVTDMPITILFLHELSW